MVGGQDLALQPHYTLEEGEDGDDDQTDDDAPSQRIDEIGIYHDDEAGYHGEGVRTLAPVHEEAKTHQADKDVPVERSYGDEYHGSRFIIVIEFDATGK